MVLVALAVRCGVAGWQAWRAHQRRHRVDPLMMATFTTRPVLDVVAPLDDQAAFDAEWEEIASRLRHPTHHKEWGTDERHP